MTRSASIASSVDDGAAPRLAARSSSTYTRKRSRRGSSSLCSEVGGPWPVTSALATTLDFAGSFYVHDRPGPMAVSRSGQPRPRAHCLGNSLDSGGPSGRFFDGRAMALEAHGQQLMAADPCVGPRRSSQRIGTMQRRANCNAIDTYS